jgi:putative thioredoxin
VIAIAIVTASARTPHQPIVFSGAHITGGKSMANDVTDFQTQVIARSHQLPVLVDFWAAWCQPCRILGPVLEKLAEQHEGEWELAKVDVDQHQDVATQYRVTGIPAVKLFVDGEVRSEFTGAQPAAAVEQWLKKAIPGKHDAKLAQARSLLAEGQRELAEAALADVLNQDHDNAEARLLLAQLKVFSEPERAIELVAAIKQGDRGYETADGVRAFAKLFIQVREPDRLPDSPARSHCLAAVSSLHEGDFDSALTSFIEAMKADRAFNDECARKACIAIFAYLGEGSDVTRKHRRAFGSALHV